MTYRTLRRRLEKIAAHNVNTPVDTAERERLAALNRRRAFEEAHPRLEIFAELSALANAYFRRLYTAEHSEMEAPDYRVSRITGPVRTAEEIIAEFLAKDAEAQRMADEWAARDGQE